MFFFFYHKQQLYRPIIH